MMKLTYTAKNPDDFEFELQVTMTLKEWKSVANALRMGEESRWTPSGNLAAGIQSLVEKARREFDFYPPAEKTDSDKG